MREQIYKSASPAAEAVITEMGSKGNMYWMPLS